tara:strand:+ start:37 stop:327 length:291 start_codon:yes stop_codon:yes gene_type:complete
MCFGGGGQMRQKPKPQFQNNPVTLTGTQTGVDNPIDTASATESLMIQRQMEEGTFNQVDPNLTTTNLLSGNSGGQVARNRRAARLSRRTSRRGSNR